MINGRFVCVGNTQYLTNKYGKGYKISLHPNPDCFEQIDACIKNLSSSAHLLTDNDQSDVYETYQVESIN